MEDRPPTAATQLRRAPGPSIAVRRAARHQAAAVALVWSLFPWFLLPAPAGAQRFNVRNYSVENGLAQSEVMAIFQDSRGYLWLGTHGGGVDRFDGSQFRHFTKREGLAGNTVTSIVEDDSRRLWFGTDEGLSRLDDRGLTTFTTADGLADDRITALSLGHAGDLWVATTGGISHRIGDRFTSLPTGDGPCHDEVDDVLEDRSGVLWFTSRGGAVCRFDGGSLTTFTSTDGLPRSRAYALQQDREGRLWVGFADGVRVFEGGRFRRAPGTEILEGKMVLSIFGDADGTLWFGTLGGLVRYDGKKSVLWTTRQGLSQDLVSAVTRDREGSLWVGTFGGGVDHLPGSAFVHFGVEDGLPNAMVFGIGRAPGGDLWIGTAAGIATFDGGRMKVVDPPGAPRGAVWEVFPRRDGEIWLGTPGGAIRFDGTSFRTFTERDGLPIHLVSSFAEDRQGRLWAGTAAGVARYGENGFEALPDPQIRGRRIRNMLRAHDGTLWFATDEGILAYDGLTFGVPKDLAELATESVMSMAEDRQGNLWLGTRHGVVLYPSTEASDRKPQRVSVENGLSDDFVYFLLFDEAENLWIGTRSGLDRLDASRYLSRREIVLRHYGAAEGFYGVEANQHAAFRDLDGSLWFGTIKGVVKYDARQDRPNALAPRTFVRGVRLFGKDTDWVAKGYGVDAGLPTGLELRHDENHLTFDYVGISLKVPEKVRYRHKLEGLERDWSAPTTATSASYPSLPPGSYRFEVIACNDQGVWNPEPAVYEHDHPSPVLEHLVVRAPLDPGDFRRRFRTVLAAGPASGEGPAALQRAVERGTEEIAEANRSLEISNRGLARANQELERLSTVDGLTGVANRRAFDACLSREWSRAQRTGTTISLVLADVDFFKRFNDTYGHQGGDDCLRRVAASCSGDGEETRGPGGSLWRRGDGHRAAGARIWTGR